MNLFSESSEADGQNNAVSAERQQSEASQTFDSASDASHDDDTTDLADSSKPKIIGLFDLASELLLGWKNLKVGVEIPTDSYYMVIVALL